MFKRIIFISLLTIPLFVNDAFAQVVIPKSAEPSRIEKLYEIPLEPLSEFELDVPKALEAPPPAKMNKIKFVLSGVVFDGATVYKDKDFLPLYKKYLGKKISLKQAYQIAHAVTAKYRNDGYILSRAIFPAQRIRNGIVRIKIFEGFIDKIIFEGDIQVSKRLLKAFSAKIKKSRPLHNDVLERYLLLTKDLPGVSVQSVLVPSKTNVGASHMTLIFKHRKADGSFNIDNRGTKFGGPIKTGFQSNLNSALGLSEKTAYRFNVTTELQESRFFNLTQNVPVDSEGTRFNASATLVKTLSGFTLSDFNIEGETFTLAFTLSHPFIRSRAENFRVLLSFDVSQSETTTLGEVTARDRLRVLKLTFSYDNTDKFKGKNQATIDLHKGLNIFNATETGSDLLTRAKGRSDFAKLTARLSRTQKIGSAWSFKAQAIGQYSFDQLLSSQEFGVGGSSFGRAYDGSTISGIQGVSVSGELNYTYQFGKFIQSVQPYVFYDYGVVWSRSDSLATLTHESLTSAGGGMRLNLAGGISASGEFAKPMAKRVPTEGDKDFRFFFKIRAGF